MHMCISIENVHFATILRKYVLEKLNVLINESIVTDVYIVGVIFTLNSSVTREKRAYLICF